MNSKISKLKLNQKRKRKQKQGARHMEDTPLQVRMCLDEAELSSSEGEGILPLLIQQDKDMKSPTTKCEKANDLPALYSNTAVSLGKGALLYKRVMRDLFTIGTKAIDHFSKQEDDTWVKAIAEAIISANNGYKQLAIFSQEIGSALDEENRKNEVLTERLENYEPGASTDGPSEKDMLRDEIRYLCEKKDEFENEAWELRKQLKAQKYADPSVAKVPTESRTPQGPTKTYANAVKDRIERLKEGGTVRHVVTIFPRDPRNTKSAETQKALEKCINPAKVGMHVKRVKSIGKGGVLVEGETKDDLEKLLKQKELLETVGLNMSIPTKKRPKMVIYNAPNIDGKELLESIRLQDDQEERKEQR